MKFYEAALKIADQKLFRDKEPGKLCSPRIGTGGGFTDIFLWDTAFSCHWAKYHPDRFPLDGSLDNFYACQDADGFISRQYHPDGQSMWSKEHPVSFAPPLLSWIELEIEKMRLFPGRLKKIYPCLKKLHEWNRRWRRADGLYFCDMWGCGMDDIPRWDSADEITPEGGILFERRHLLDRGEKWDRFYESMTRENPMHLVFYWNRQLAWVDTNCQAAFDCLNLAEIARILGNEKDAEDFQKEYSDLALLINEKLFDKEKGFYCDRSGEKLLNHMHIGGFWALISGVATSERADRLAEHLLDPETFGLPYGIPGIARKNPEFGIDHLHYWRGPVWCPTEYMVLRGLLKYGKDALANQLAERFYESVFNIWQKTGTVWENYSPLQCDTPSEAAGRDFCGWSALAPVAICREFVENIR